MAPSVSASVTEATGISVVVGVWAAFALLVLAVVYAVLRWSRRRIEEHDPFQEPWYA